MSQTQFLMLLVKAVTVFVGGVWGNSSSLVTEGVAVVWWIVVTEADDDGDGGSGRIQIAVIMVVSLVAGGYSVNERPAIIMY
ncbi:hypothetical protein L1887_14713 [Cichorium endivia]|nr:hypothetical protein L1887_14713 [Cichorium endivia]